MNGRFWLAIALGTAAVASSWMAWHQRDAAPQAATANNTADYVLHDFQIVGLDAQGKESVTLRAPHLARQSEDETVDIQTPLFLLPDGNGHHWQLAAATGWLSADGDQLRLQGGVSGHSPAGADIAPTTFRTESLTAFPRRNLVQTDDAVEITQPGLRQTGVGMQLDTTTQNLRLLSQVRTRYEPSAAR